MNNKKWLVRVASLTATLALSLSFGLAACTPSVTPGPDDGTEHTHSYTQWAHDDTQHWKVCPDDNAADESTKAAHSFTDGACECGATEGTTVPDVELDTREFYVVGGGMGDLKDATWNTCAAQYKFTKAEKADANGNTVYTYQLKLYSGDEFKFIQPTTITSGSEGEVWDDSTVLSFSDFDATAVKGIFKEVNGNITVEVGADGIYEFTIRTKKGGDIHANKVEVKLIEKLDSMGVLAQYDMYLVGTIASKSGCNWPSLVGVANVPSKCIHMELQADGKTFSVQVDLSTNDAFKVWNYKLGNVNAGYYPTGVGGDLKVTKAGTYLVSWVVGEDNVSVTYQGGHTHKFNYWVHNDTEHWKVCLEDSEIDETSRASHVYDDDADDICNACQYKRHLHTFSEWRYDEEQHWKSCPTDNVADESSKTAHNFVGGTCECGATQAAQGCKHEEGMTFNYTSQTVPNPVIEGGTVSGICNSCGAEVLISYDRGAADYQFQSDNYFSKTVSAPTELTPGTIYGRLSTNQMSSSGYVGFRVTASGKYSVRMLYEVLNTGVSEINVSGISMSTEGYLSTTKAGVIRARKWDTTEHAEKYKDRIVSVPLPDEDGVYKRADYIEFNFKTEDIGLYVVLTYSVTGAQPDNTYPRGYFILAFETPEAATASFAAPAEVAVLPKKEY